MRPAKIHQLRLVFAALGVLPHHNLCTVAGILTLGERKARPRVGTGRVVEVPGIEPGSCSASPGLLRAQLTRSLLGPTNHVSELV
jgi:hypothetical protein